VSTRSKNDDFPVQYRKPRPDVYTVLLILALIAILVTILCLWAEMGMYDSQLKGRTSAMASPAAAELAMLPGTSAATDHVIAFCRPPTPGP
jgi:hypothetical protein